MELNQIEITQLAKVDADSSALTELVELQLALVGGGIGETVL